jgi:integrase
MNLDAKTIAALDAGGKRDVIFFDDILKGFGFRLRVGGNGKVLKSWIAQYKKAGATRRLLLGSAEVLSAEQARAAAKKVLAQVALGQDPQASKSDRRSKDRISVRSIVDEYLTVKRQLVRARTFHELSRYLTGPYFKPLHTLPIDKVTRKDVASRLVAITRETSSITACRARTALSAFFVWSLKMGLVENNPVINTFQPADSKGRARVLSDNELAQIWRACGEDDGGRITRLLILLGCRRAEVGSMEWDELEFETAQWTLPAARAKNGRALTLPLLPMALDIIAATPRLASRPQLFGVRGKGYSDWSRYKKTLDKASGVIGWTLHDIRRTFATRLNDLGVPPHVVETVLNHQSGHKAGTAGTYNKSIYEREVRQALALWTDHIRTLIGDGERRIIPLRQ